MREPSRTTVQFDRLASEILAVLGDALEWKSLAAGEQLYAFGDDGDTMYIVVEGQLQELVPGQAGENVVVAELGPQRIIGEIQLLIGGKRSATVRTLTP